MDSNSFMKLKIKIGVCGYELVKRK